mmetsp:Transcript_13255/g.16375  ORF Transcript_13255/g.16375 Transcript_13255/m.16375 type:complete len:158 (-) Transcript_13255:89-562(-)
MYELRDLYTIKSINNSTYLWCELYSKYMKLKEILNLHKMVNDKPYNQNYEEFAKKVKQAQKEQNEMKVDKTIEMQSRIHANSLFEDNKSNDDVSPMSPNTMANKYSNYLSMNDADIAYANPLFIKQAQMQLSDNDSIDDDDDDTDNDSESSDDRVQF